MKKPLLLFIAIIAIAGYSRGQITDRTGPDTTYVNPWKKGGKMAVTFSQVSFSNWAAGGENSLGGNSLLSLFANFKEGKRIWDNQLDMAFGMVKLADQEARKSDDKIDLLSKYGLEMTKSLYFSTNFNFRTQFAKGYNYPNDSIMVSRFMSPGYLQLGLGFDYKPVEYFSLSFLPLTGRVTFVTDQDLANIGAYGVDPATFDTITGEVIEPGKNSRFELGTAIIALFQKEIIKNVEFKSKLQLFSNYLEKPQNFDVNWDSMLALKVNKYISTYVGVILMYDEDVPILNQEGVDAGPDTQIKQTFGIGLAFDF